MNVVLGVFNQAAQFLLVRLLILDLTGLLDLSLSKFGISIISRAILDLLSTTSPHIKINMLGI